MQATKLLSSLSGCDGLCVLSLRCFARFEERHEGDLVLMLSTMVPALLQLGTLLPTDAMFSLGASTSKSSFALVLSGRDLHLRELGIGWALVGLRLARVQ